MKLGKDILGMQQLSKEQILEIMNTAKTMKQIVLSNNKKTSHLQGKSIITSFYENSTRTRLSFELGAKYLGGVAANIAASSSSVAKGETLIDTGTSAFYQNATFMIAEDAGIDKYKYVGPLDGRTRDFCRKHIGQVKTKEQWDAVPPAAGQPGPVSVYRGGWSCRHQLSPVVDE